MPVIRPRAGAVLLCLLLALTAPGCSPREPEPVTLRVLASSDLTDMQPLLDDLRRETGVRLVMDYRGTVEATDALDPGHYQHDLAWLSSDRYLRLKLKATRSTAPMPLSTRVMDSPVAIGMKPAVAARLRAGTPGRRLTWADIADDAAAGRLTFGMADPRLAGSGLAALVGVATAAAGTGVALRPGDVTCDRLRGLFSGQRLTAGTSAELAGQFVARQDDTDALISYESGLLSLNASGALREPLEIVYPQDGIVLSDYPLMLLHPEQRDAYDRVTAWLMSAPAQRRIMERTWRRPMNPAVTRDARLGSDIGNSLYFPDDQAVLDKLLADYRTGAGSPGHVVFLLDYSGSMRGRRLDRLRATFAGLSGSDRTPAGKFTRFYRGETITVVRFGGRVLDERSFTVEGPADLDAVQAFLDRDDLADRTAVYSALLRGYQLAAPSATGRPARPVSVVLMTDGENNAGIGLDAFLARYRALPAAVRAVPTYAIGLGEADQAELRTVAERTGGRTVRATAESLRDVLKEVRGCG